MNLFTKRKHTHRLKKQNLLLPGEKGSGGGIVRSWNLRVYTAILEMDNQQGLPVYTGNTAQYYVAN